LLFVAIRQSTVVVTGVPSKAYRLPTNWIQPNTVVVNVASFKNVDEDTLLQIPGVIYIPQVGKVTVAMLERNLMRLFENFHHPHQSRWRNTQRYDDSIKKESQTNSTSWWNLHIVHLYTASAVTLLLILELLQRGKR
jgi:hypothetical protein